MHLTLERRDFCVMTSIERSFGLFGGVRYTATNTEGDRSQTGKTGIRGILGAGNNGVRAGEPGHEPADSKESEIPALSIRGVIPTDLVEILQWSADPEVRGHLDPAPRIPEDWGSEEDLLGCVIELNDYYKNQDDDRKKITPLVAVNDKDEPVGVLTIRWRGDPYVPKGSSRVASIERFIVNPQEQGHHVGTVLLASAIEHVFESGYYGINSDLPAQELRAWTMEDEQAGDWRKNVNLMKKFGFQPIPGSNWQDYARRRNLETGGRGNGTWWRLKPEWYQEKKLHDSSIKPSGNISV